MARFTDKLEECLPDLWRYAFALTRDHHRADDLVQDTCERALRRRHLYLPNRPMRPWLMRILLNIFRSELRRSGGRIELPLEAVQLPPATGADPETRLELAEVLRRVDALPDDQRETLLLVVVGGLTYAEAARALGVAQGTVMSRIARARKRLLEAELRGKRTAAQNLRRVK